MRSASGTTRGYATAFALLTLLLSYGSAAAQQKPLTLQDYPKWNRIGSASISDDGRWMAYAYTPNEGDARLFFRQLDGTRVDTIARGAGGTFSNDGKWVLYTVAQAQRGGGGGQRATGGRGQQPPQNPPQTPPQRGGRGGGQGGGPRTQVLRNVETKDTWEVTDIASASFTANSRYGLFKRNRAEGATAEGSDLLIRELATGSIRHIGNVVDFSLNKGETLLAYTVDAADNAGNGLYILHLDNGMVDVLDAAQREYAQLTWHEDGSSLAVLRGEKKRENLQRDNVLLVFAGFGGKGPVRTIALDPAKATGFPSGMVISEFTALSWSGNGQRIFLGIKAQEPEPPQTAEARANVDVWHWKDEVVQSVQMVRSTQERRATLGAVYHIDTNKFVRLADEDMPTVTRTVEGNGRYGIGRLDKPYRYEITWGGSRGDYYRVDVTTGERTLLEKSLGRTYGTSPDGKWFVFLRDQKLYAREVETGRTQNLSEIAGVSFLDHRDDHPYEIPIYGVAGWSKDNKAILLYDDFDVWSVPVDGGKAVNLTSGVGNAEQIRFRIVRLFDGDEEGGGGGRGGGGGGGGGGGSNAIDLTQPIYLSAYGEWTKKSGYYELKPGGKPTPIVFEDASIGGVSKAAKADRIIFTKQTFVDFPNYYVSNTRFQNAQKVTDANPQQAEYAWGRRILVDYTNSKGQKLQATLALPANYQEGRRYPMVVYFYEIMSNVHHRYSMPTYDDRPHMSTYASDGYLVLQPDVVYETGRPGTSAVDCVTSAVKKVIELGYADPARVGLQGHSWGGYQSSFIVTQTDMFAAVVTGAPVTNLTSFIDELYKSSGNVQQGIVERGQVRMGTSPYDDYELFRSQSPIHQAKNIKTPFLILHGTDDGSVDWHQGLAYYNAARRVGKKVILLSYPGEGHHLGRKENQIDFQIRMKQFFDHYLKGKPAAKWITDGVPQLLKGRETDVVIQK